MKYRKLTNVGDYSFGNNGQDYISDAEAVAQAVKTKILLFYNEWWEDLGQGIPMFQSILGNASFEGIKDSLQMLLKDRILGVPNISSVDEINIVQDKNRTVTITIRCTTTSGETAETEVKL